MRTDLLLFLGGVNWVYSVFQEVSSDIDELMDAVLIYVSFCKESVIPTDEVKFFPDT